LDNQKSARLFDAIDHSRDPRLAANSIIDGKLSAVAIIDTDRIDAGFLELALERQAREEIPTQCFLSINSSGTIPLSRLRAENLITIIGNQSLALSDYELRAGLSKVGRKVDRGRIARLAGTWPVVFDLLLAFFQSASVDELDLTDADLLRASGVFEFINQHFSPLISIAEWNSLTRASLLSDPKVSHLRNGDRDDRTLSALAQRFAGLVNQRGQSFEINPALRAYCLDQSIAQDSVAHKQTMLDMADLCSSAGQLTDAARLAAEAGCPERIAAYAEEHGALLIWVLCGFSNVQALVDCAGEEVITPSPALRMMRCIVDLKLGHINKAEAELRELASEPQIVASMEKEIEIVRVTLLVYGCSLARQNDLELLSGLLAENSPEPAWQTFLATLSLILNTQRAKFPNAMVDLREARRHAERAGSSYNLMFLHLHEAAMELAQGLPNAARRNVAMARRSWKVGFADDVGVETLIAALSASIEYETGRLTSSQNALRKSAYRMPEAEAWFDIYWAAYEPMVRLHLRNSGLEPTLELLVTEREKLISRGLDRVARLLSGLAVCLVGEQQIKLGCELSLPYFEIGEEDPYWSWQERETYTLARAHQSIALGKIQDALIQLATGQAAAQKLGLRRSQMRYQVLEFMLLQQNGDGRALTTLHNLISDGAELGMSQYMADFAGGCIRQAPLEIENFPELKPSESKFLARVIGESAAPRTAANAELSSREIEVLLALTQGGSDKELARQLGISDNGVRYHLKNVFRKLKVHDRLSAVAKARDRNLV
jgi:LuxR family maltose regulon positive regulatory protein